MSDDKTSLEELNLPRKVLEFLQQNPCLEVRIESVTTQFGTETELYWEHHSGKWLETLPHAVRDTITFGFKISGRYRELKLTGPVGRYTSRFSSCQSARLCNILDPTFRKKEFYRKWDEMIDGLMRR